ncbi:hypothetical protein ACFUIY_10285 [Streptomyces griseorubiginosus]|uniref:hypothetical protein n=1 Tax=Streptomyces griseorubiginosus TaxID=67304 RepID=UPI0036459603
MVDYKICDDAPDAAAILKSLTSEVSGVMIYSNYTTRKTAYHFIEMLQWLAAMRKEKGEVLKASDFSDDPSGFRWVIQSDYFKLASSMFTEQSVLANRCETPQIK